MAQVARAAAPYLLGLLAILAFLSRGNRTPALPIVLEPPVQDSIDKPGRMPVADRRYRLLVRLQKESRTFRLRFRNLTKAKRTARVIQHGIVRSKTHSDLDTWEQQLERLLKGVDPFATLTHADQQYLNPIIDHYGISMGVYSRLEKAGAKDPRAFVLALIRTESGFNPEAVSHAGAVGLMQVMPDTAAGYGVHSNLSGLPNNIKVGMSYLKDSLDAFGRLDLALAAYNSGIQRVRDSLQEHGGIPRIPETQAYVRSVLREYNRRVAAGP